MSKASATEQHPPEVRCSIYLYSRVDTTAFGSTYTYNFAFNLSIIISKLTMTVEDKKNNNLGLHLKLNHIFGNRPCQQALNSIHC